MNEILFLVIALFLMMLAYVGLLFLVGGTISIRPVCPAGYRALSVDGSRSLMPKNSTDIVTPTADYPICSQILSCPLNGLPWAIRDDGSALSNNCEEPGCPCSAFQHCPAYASTLFRQYGFDDRISLFQVIDPLAKDKTHPQDPYDTPYVLTPASRDSCYLTPNTIDMVWPPLKLGGACLRGTLGRVSTSPALYVCAPSQYVTFNSKTATFDFDVTAYKNAYHT